MSNRILDNINGRFKEKLDVTVWKNSAAVIEWFKSIEMKEHCTFINQKTTSEEVDIIQHSRKSRPLCLAIIKHAWMKKEGSGVVTRLTSYCDQ